MSTLLDDLKQVKADLGPGKLEAALLAAAWVEQHADEIIELIEAAAPYGGMIGTPEGERFAAALRPFLEDRR